jgi:hypothetical protein
VWNDFTDTGVKKSKAQVTAETIGSKIDSGLDSTGGMGIYFAIDPTEPSVLDHLYGSSLVCSTAGLKVVSLQNPITKADLEKAEILVPPAWKKDKWKQFSTFIVSPTGKNLFAHPRDFEKAAKGLLISFRPDKIAGSRFSLPPYVIDKFAIDYKKCWKIQMDDFKHCHLFAKVIDMKTPAAGKLRKLLKNSPGFQGKFDKIWERCTKDAYQKIHLRQVADAKKGCKRDAVPLNVDVVVSGASATGKLRHKKEDTVFLNPCGFMKKVGALTPDETYVLASQMISCKSRRGVPIEACPPTSDLYNPGSFPVLPMCPKNKEASCKTAPCGKSACARPVPPLGLDATISHVRMVML